MEHGENMEKGFEEFWRGELNRTITMLRMPLKCATREKNMQKKKKD